MTSARFSALVDELDALAATTWHKIAVGPSRGLTFGEEGLTDHNLFTLDERQSALHVYKFDKAEESFNGADFDWWVGSASIGWTAMRFQAKKLHDGVYANLGHYVRGERQYELLLRQARADGVWPMYCFYNGWDGGWPGDVRNRICRAGRTPGPDGILDRGQAGWCTHAALEHFGCAVTTAEVVRRRHGGPRRDRLALEGYLGDSIPWSHLFTAAAEAEDAGADAASILAVLEGFLSRLFTSLDSGEADPRRHETLPGWIAALLDGEREEFRHVPKPATLIVHDLLEDG